MGSDACRAIETVTDPVDGKTARIRLHSVHEPAHVTVEDR